MPRRSNQLEVNEGDKVLLRGTVTRIEQDADGEISKVTVQMDWTAHKETVALSAIVKDKA